MIAYSCCSHRGCCIFLLPALANVLSLYLLLAAQAEFKDEQYADMDSWFKNRKPAILAMNPLANLPYIVDGDKCVCQTNAVFWYLGDKYNLNGSTAEEKLDNMQLLNEIYDVRNKMIELVYPFKQVLPAFKLARV